MSEKKQHTAANLRKKMSNRYEDNFHHKHNKNQSFSRQRWKTHPSDAVNKDNEKIMNSSTGLLRELKLRKIRKRLDKGHFH